MLSSKLNLFFKLQTSENLKWPKTITQLKSVFWRENKDPKVLRKAVEKGRRITQHSACIYCERGRRNFWSGGAASFCRPELAWGTGGASALGEKWEIERVWYIRVWESKRENGSLLFVFIFFNKYHFHSLMFL